MWLLEIYLNELGVLRTAGRQSSQEFINLQKEFINLFRDPRIKVGIISFINSCYFLFIICIQAKIFKII